MMGLALNQRLWESNKIVAQGIETINYVRVWQHGGQSAFLGRGSISDNPKSGIPLTYLMNFRVIRGSHHSS